LAPLLNGFEEPDTMNWRRIVLKFALSTVLVLGHERQLLAHEVNQPRVFFRSEEGSDRYPSFVSADAVLAANGTIDETLFSPEAIDSIRSLLATAPQGDCIRVENYYESYVNPPVRSSIGAAARSSHLILLGTVVEKTFGFSGFTPGQLLHIRPDQAIKGTTKEDLYFVFLPIGNFSVGAARICKTDTRYATPPEVGEQILALIPKLWNSEQSGAFLNTFDEAGVITIKDDETLSLPRRYRENKTDSTPTNKQGLLQLVRDLIEKEK
jgi:hypothetical protein